MARGPAAKATVIFVGLAVLVGVANVAATASGQALNEMSLDRWKKLREVERYQLQIAERYYREKNWKVAAAEYEKYLTLYERSDAASYCQLKWSLAQVQLRKHNTAIKDGFQSVIDYWPESPDATAAAYYIGNTYKAMGQVGRAKRAYNQVLEKHKKHVAAVYSMVDLIDISTIEKDLDSRVKLWRKLTFDVPRNRQTSRVCATASQQLAGHLFSQAAFDDGVKALATTYKPTQLPDYVVSYARSQVSRLCREKDTKKIGDKLADLTVAYLKSEVPADTTEKAQRDIARRYWFHMAEVQASAGREKPTEAVYQQMEKLFGVEDDLLGHWAGWHKGRNRYDQARAIYRRYKDQVEGLNQVAYSFRQQRNTKSAVAVYQQLLQIDPEGLVRWLSETGATYRDARDYANCIQVYEQLYKEDTGNEMKWRWEIATAHRDWGKYKDAIAHFRQCDNFPSNYQEMAGCHRKLKQYREALVLYNQIVGGAPQSAPWALLQIGYTREEAKQKEQAIQAFQKVCKQFPKDRYASVAHAHLQTKYKISVTLGGATDK